MEAGTSVMGAAQVIRVHTDEFKCPHGIGWIAWADDTNGKKLGMAWERETAQEAKDAAIGFFQFLDKDVMLCRIKRLKT